MYLHIVQVNIGITWKLTSAHFSSTIGIVIISVEISISSSVVMFVLPKGVFSTKDRGTMNNLAGQEPSEGGFLCVIAECTG